MNVLNLIRFFSNSIPQGSWKVGNTRENWNFNPKGQKNPLGNYVIIVGRPVISLVIDTYEYFNYHLGTKVSNVQDSREKGQRDFLLPENGFYACTMFVMQVK